MGLINNNNNKRKSKTERARERKKKRKIKRGKREEVDFKVRPHTMKIQVI
jgi:hypothetical protein